VSAETQHTRQELDTLKRKLGWYESEMGLARKAGYNPSPNGEFDPQSVSTASEADKPLVEALVAMKQELDDVQSTVSDRILEAAKRVALAEQQRDSAIKEAIYAKAKLAAHGGSQAGTPQLDDSARDLDSDRSTEISRKLGAALTLQNELRTKLESMTAQHETERHARDIAEQNSEAAHRRAAELEKDRQPGELEQLRADLHDAQRLARDHAADKNEAHSRAKMLEIEKEDLTVQLNQHASTSTDHETMLIYLRQAMTASQEKSFAVEAKLQSERSSRELLQKQLQEIKYQHESQTNELEMTTQKLRDTEEMAERHAAEAQTHRSAVLMGLNDRVDRSRDTSGGANSQASEKRVTALKEQVDEAIALAQKSRGEADGAAEKLRSAEERIAGLETYQQQSSRENMSIRKQLQDAIKTAQAMQAQHADVKQQLENHQRNTSALTVQHGVLRDLLDEHAGTASGGTPANPDRLRDLEQRLEESERAHEETRMAFESNHADVEGQYKERLEQLEQDYQSAVSYVKGTEKIVKRMKDELTKSKNVNARLEKELEKSARSGSRAGSQPPAAWEAEKRALQREIQDTHEGVRESVVQLEGQVAHIQGELRSAEKSREQLRQENEQLSSLMLRTRGDLEKLRGENVTLEARAGDAEHKVGLLLDQVESSVDSYRRSRISLGLNGGPGAGHARNTSLGSNYTSATPRASMLPSGGGGGHHQRDESFGSESQFSSGGTQSDDRTSMALDNLASELETLRTQWEGTHKSYRLSNTYNLDLDRVMAGGAAGAAGGAGGDSGGELSNSLASWRKRLEADEMGKGPGGSRGPADGGHGSHGPGGGGGGGGAMGHNVI